MTSLYLFVGPLLWDMLNLNCCVDNEAYEGVALRSPARSSELLLYPFRLTEHFEI